MEVGRVPDAPLESLLVLARQLRDLGDVWVIGKEPLDDLPLGWEKPDTPC